MVCHYNAVKQRAQKLWQQHQEFAPAIFFLGGFLFDVFTLERADSILQILQQLIFIILVFLYLTGQLLFDYDLWAPPRKLGRLWIYRVEVVHFLIGGLLSAFTLFFFKSSSLTASFLFLFLMVALLVANEFTHFQSMGLPFKFALASLCLICFANYITPIIIGHIGIVTFLLSMIISLAVIGGLSWSIRKKGLAPQIIIRKVITPSLIVSITFLTLYLLKWVPPVPLSLKYIGIYHKVEKTQKNTYKAHYEKSWWEFWQHADEDFVAYKGERIYVFYRLFSPAQFSDKVLLVWSKYFPKQGWVVMDKMVFPIAGGRQEGYRGYAYKENYSEGDWRIQVQTLGEREIGRLEFEVAVKNKQRPASEAFKTRIF